MSSPLDSIQKDVPVLKEDGHKGHLHSMSISLPRGHIPSLFLDTSLKFMYTKSTALDLFCLIVLNVGQYHLWLLFFINAAAILVHLSES